MNTTPLARLLEQAFDRRQVLIEKLSAAGTNAYRLFHGVAEGRPGLTIDRYGPLLLTQTFREPLAADELTGIQAHFREKLTYPFVFAYNHRGSSATESIQESCPPNHDLTTEFQCLEFGLNFLIRARHQGIDPWLFLDLRAGRRFLRDNVKGLSVLNLFSYTCSVGVTAAAAGASEVWNIDFASSSLEIGRRNAALNGLSEPRFKTIESDCLPAMRQLAGLPPGGRFGKKAKFLKLAQREFDLVFLDPPAWSKGPFGAVDVAGDYPSLFKPALLATKASGGKIIATNHVASVDLASWTDVLMRCATKAGRPIRSLRTLTPEEDFPSFDGRPPLKVVVCEV